MFEKNVRLLGDKLSPYLVEMNKVIESETQVFEVVDSKTDVPTLKVNIDGRELFLHSKYNPIQEAERLVNHMDPSVLEKDHVIFFGVGLGYHIEQFAKKYPQKTFSIVEPHAEVFLRFLEYKSLENFPIHKLQYVYIKSQKVSLIEYLSFISEKIHDTSVYVLPFYERLYPIEVNDFFKTYKEAIKITKANYVAKQSFGKRWILNSLMNLPTTLKTKNILDKKEHFVNKPIVIISAGPSLEEDLKYLKHIKNKKQAYLFAVGSANKALINNNILPDAIITYDPQPHNIRVISDLIKSTRLEIPVIFATSVGFETIDAYKGPKFHFVNSRDTVTNFYKNKLSKDYDTLDSTTVALISIQLAEQLGANKIILSGQNLAFRDNRYYSSGIKYDDWKGEVREDREGLEITTVKDVYGNIIKTNENLLNMKKDIETYLYSSQNLFVINTTKGGAHIEGTIFKPIEKVIEEDLIDNSVDEKWYIDYTEQISQKIVNQIETMEISINRANNTLENINSILQHLKQAKKLKKINKIQRLFESLNKQLNKLINNIFYKTYLEIILQLDIDIVNQNIKLLNQETNILTKTEGIILIFEDFMKNVVKLFNEITVFVQTVVHPQLLEEVLTDWKLYKHHDGVFNYKGSWEREVSIFNDFKSNEIKPIISTMSNKYNDFISFKFKGTSLKIFAKLEPKIESEILIKIDGIEKIVRINSVNKRMQKMFQEVFEITALKNKMHTVQIILKSNSTFYFQGAAVNAQGRIYHIDEVEKIQELKLGTRIRSHYNLVNKQFSNGLGEEISGFLPVDATNKNEGDFYFIAVREIEKDKLLLIADRVIHKYISWEILKELDYTSGKIIHPNKMIIRSLNHNQNTISLVNSNISLVNDEFEQYIINDPLTMTSNENYFKWNWLIFSWMCNLINIKLPDGKQDNRAVSRTHPNHPSKSNGLGTPFIDYYSKYIGFRPVLLLTIN